MKTALQHQGFAFLTNEAGILSTGVLYEVEKPTLAGELTAIASRAEARGVPAREDLLRAFM